MESFKIFAENRLEINYKYFDKSTCQALNEPACYLIRTDSYSTDTVKSFQKLLSTLELEKASKFRFIKDQQRYIITHGMLRIILGKFLELAPAEIEFVTSYFGKPSLPEKYKKIYFNLSHSAGLSVLGFSKISEIGIDVEKIDPKFDFDLIAYSHFSNAENSFIHEKQDEACKRFYTLWTRKEAFLKAIGTGIGENLGIEVFRKINHFRPEIPCSEIPGGNFYLNSFEFQNEYLISTASMDSGKFAGFVDLESHLSR